MTTTTNTTTCDCCQPVNLSDFRWVVGEQERGSNTMVFTPYANEAEARPMYDAAANDDNVTTAQLCTAAHLFGLWKGSALKVLTAATAAGWQVIDVRKQGTTYTTHLTHPTARQHLAADTTDNRTVNELLLITDTETGKYLSGAGWVVIDGEKRRAWHYAKVSEFIAEPVQEPTRTAESLARAAAADASRTAREVAAAVAYEQYQLNIVAEDVDRYARMSLQRLAAATVPTVDASGRARGVLSAAEDAVEVSITAQLATRVLSLEGRVAEWDGDTVVRLYDLASAVQSVLAHALSDWDLTDRSVAHLTVKAMQAVSRSV